MPPKYSSHIGFWIPIYAIDIEKNATIIGLRRNRTLRHFYRKDKKIPSLRELFYREVLLLFITKNPRNVQVIFLISLFQFLGFVMVCT